MIIEIHALCQCAKIVCEYILQEKKFFERNLRGDFIVLVRKSFWLFLFFKTHPYLYPNDCYLKVGATMWLNVPQHQHYFLGDRFSWIILRRSKLMVLFHPCRCYNIRKVICRSSLGDYYMEMKISSVKLKPSFSQA